MAGHRRYRTAFGVGQPAMADRLPVQLDVLAVLYVEFCRAAKRSAGDGQSKGRELDIGDLAAGQLAAGRPKQTAGFAQAQQSAHDLVPPAAPIGYPRARLSMEAAAHGCVYRLF